MSNKTLIDQIRHYQKDIERSPDNAERMIRCIKRLYVMPILVQHLQETGVGRSVNALRKYNGEVGEAAKALVAKWKAMVAAEESSDGEQVQEKPAEKAPEVVKSSKHGQSGRHHSDSEGGKKKEDRHRQREEKKHGSSRSKHSRHHKEEEEEEEEDSEDSSSKRKRKKHSSSKHEKSKKMKVVKEESEPESEERAESSESDASDRVGDNRSEVEEEEEEEEEEVVEEEASSEEEEAKAPQKEESSEAEESDHRHRSKHKHHKSSRSKSSHSSKERHSSSHHSSTKRSHHSSSHHSSSSTNKKSTDIKTLIKENEKKIKKEKEEKEVAREEKEVAREEKRPAKSEKPDKPSKVKIEKNEDGSIDAGSGASFAEALMVGDFSSSSKKKKKVGSSSSPPKKKESKPGAENSPGSSSSGSNIKVESSGKGSPSKINDLMKMPDLLSKKIKMESLNLDISATLPEISPHYKPLPHVHDLGPTRRLSKGVLEEEAMCSIMTTKYQRTKVFSGNKTGAFAVVPSLYSLCIQLLYENIDAVEFTGGVPYDILKPLLEKLNADQLYVLEHHNPYLIEDTDHLWQFHSKKDFRGEQRGDMESWRDLYLRCVDERERKLKALTANITKSMQKSVPVRQAKLAYVDSVVKPPRNVARKQAKYGTGSNQEKKQEILKKAVVGANNPAVMAKESVPPPPAPSRATQQILKKKKAPLMAKALQLIKGNRFKR